MSNKRWRAKNITSVALMGLTASIIGAPTAGAVGGYPSATTMIDREAVNAYIEANPGMTQAELDRYIATQAPMVINPDSATSTWGYMGGTGYHENIDGGASTIDGFTAFLEGGKSPEQNNAAGLKYDKKETLADLQNTYRTEDGALARDFSMDSKKVLYVAYSIINDIVENDGLTQQTKDFFIENGYDGDFGETALREINDGGIVTDGKVELVASDYPPGGGTIRNTTADVVSTATTIAAIHAWTSDMIGNPDIGPAVNEKRASKPVNTNTILMSVSDSDWGYQITPGTISDLARVIVEASRGVTDEDINSSDLSVYSIGSLTSSADRLNNPPMFSIADSSPAPVTELEVPSEADHKEPGYEDTEIKAGEEERIIQSKEPDVSEGSTFALQDSWTPPEGWEITVDNVGGFIDITAPEGSEGDSIEIPITVTYSDDSVDNITASVTVAEVSSDPSDPTDDPSDPSDEPSDPSDPSDEPSDPSDPANPTDDPSDPSDPSDEPSDPSDTDTPDDDIPDDDSPTTSVTPPDDDETPGGDDGDNSTNDGDDLINPVTEPVGEVPVNNSPISGITPGNTVNGGTIPAPATGTGGFQGKVEPIGGTVAGGDTRADYGPKVHTGGEVEQKSFLEKILSIFK